MKVYDADHIRNVALVGHHGSGKTMLTEAMLYASGTLNRMGSIEEGNTVSDYHDSETVPPGEPADRSRSVCRRDGQPGKREKRENAGHDRTDRSVG